MTALLKTTRMTCETTLSGLAATFDLSGGLYLPDEGILIVADLHLEKGSSFARKGMMLERIRGRIIHKPLDRVSPLSVSVMLEIGRERVYSDDADEILAEAEATLLDEALA